MGHLYLHALPPVALDDADVAVFEKGDVPAEKAALGHGVHVPGGAADDVHRLAPVGELEAAQRDAGDGMGDVGAHLFVDAVGDDLAALQIDGEKHAADGKVVHDLCVGGGAQRGEDDVYLVAVGVGGDAHGVEAMGVEAIHLRMLDGHLSG